jgi:hypothetical protein
MEVYFFYESSFLIYNSILLNSFKEDTELFGILCRFPGEKDKFFSFKVLIGQDIEKKDYIKQLAQGICNVKCMTEIVSQIYLIVCFS